jgi:hypothetical protein
MRADQHILTTLEGLAVPRRLQKYGSDFAQPADRAWISPEGEVHPVPMMTHMAWVSKNKWPHIAKNLHKRSALDTAMNMLDHGWIRKVKPDLYSTEPEHVERVLDHVRKYHPNLKKVTILHKDTSEENPLGAVEREYKVT